MNHKLMAAEVLPVPVTVQPWNDDDGNTSFGIIAPSGEAWGPGEQDCEMVARCINEHDALTARIAELESALSTLADSYDSLLKAYGKPHGWGYLKSEIARAILAK